MQKIKNLIWVLRNLKQLWTLQENRHIMEAFLKIFEQVVKTQKEGRPYISDLVVNTGDGTKLSDFVTIWTGSHDASPFKRLRAVLEQRDTLKKVLSEMSIPEERKAEIELMLKNFN